MDNQVYELKRGKRVFRVDRAEVERLARAVAAGPEFGLADQLAASITEPSLLTSAPAQAFDADVVLPPKDPSDHSEITNI